MPELKRELGLVETTISGVGIILGVGIYVLIGVASGMAGNVTWLSFLIGAVIAGFTALSYAELSSIFPKAGAEYVYTEQAFGKRLAFLVGWLIIIGTMFAAATIALGFGGYFTEILPIPVPVTAIVLIALCSFLNFYGIKESAVTAVIFTFIEVAGLVLIVIIAIPYLGKINYFEFSDTGYTGLFKAAALLFFSFLGFESITRLAEETRKPEKTIPMAILLSLFISALIYVLVTVAALSVVPWQELAKSKAPLSDIAFAVLGGNTSVIFAVIALFATSNSALLTLVTGTRIVYGMAESKIFPEQLRLDAIHKTRKTPWVAVTAAGVLSMLFISIGNIQYVGYSTGFTVFITFTIINLAVIWLRYKRPEIKRSFRSPSIGNFPIVAAIGAVTSIMLAIYVGKGVLIGGAVIIIIGLLLFEVLNSRKRPA